MIKSVLKHMFRRFGASHDYDVTYMTNIANADTAGALKLAFASFFTSHQFGLPLGPYFAAKFIAARAAGCGPCVMLVISMAEKQGVSRSELAVIAKSGNGGDPDMRLAARYAAAVVDNSPELFFLLDEVRNRFGEKGITGLAAAVSGGQFYPLLKRGLGQTLSCELLPVEFRHD